MPLCVGYIRVDIYMCVRKMRVCVRVRVCVCEREKERMIERKSKSGRDLE